MSTTRTGFYSTITREGSLYRLAPHRARSARRPSMSARTAAWVKDSRVG